MTTWNLTCDGGRGVSSLSLFLLFLVFLRDVRLFCRRYMEQMIRWMTVAAYTSSSSRGSGSDQYLIVHLYSQCVLLL